MEFRDDYKDRTRVSHYSVLYDGYGDVTGSQVRTATEKFIWQGVTTCKALIRARLMTEPESAMFIDSFLRDFSSSSNTLNGAAFAIVFTTYDIERKIFLIDPKKIKDDDVVKQKSWFGLVDRLNQISKQPRAFRDVVEKYGMTPSSLWRYLRFLSAKIKEIGLKE